MKPGTAGLCASHDGLSGGEIMATASMHTDGHDHPESSELSIGNEIKRILEPLASLKLTVVLFALSIFLILAGTFAQVDKDIWEVIGLYFRCWFAWVPLQVFFPQSFSPEKPIVIADWIGIWFPGGKLLGLLLAINLVAAHLVRFKAVATGGRLMMGVIGIAVGCLITWAIVASGGNSKGILSTPWLPYSTQWIAYQGLLGLAVVAAGFGLYALAQQPLAKASDNRVRQRFLRGVLAFLGVVSAALLAWIWSRGDQSQPTDASMRILWQLTQGTAASLALFLGCWAVFGKRAGVVLLHGGIGLMMFYELHVALTAVETQMTLAEGEHTNYVQDIRTFELAIVDVTDPYKDNVVVIPKSVVLGKGSIDVAELPFKIAVSDFKKNSKLRAVSSRDKNLATGGNGLEWFAEAAKPGAGTDNDSRIDMPAAYATLESKSDGKPIGTYLISLVLSMNDESDTVKIGDHSYRIEFRPKRYYKPYVFDLQDVSKKDYLGTSTPRSYASTVHIQDSTRHVDEVKTIWMNNPLRFADETFYQSGYIGASLSEPERATLSVVANSGWMMPYVGCMLVGVGMLTHFLTMLVQFLTRSDVPEISAEDAARASKLAAKLGIKPLPQGKSSEALILEHEPKPTEWSAYLFAAVMAAMGGVYIVAESLPPAPRNLSFDLYKFGQIPVVSEGRAKPLDSAARADLLAISGGRTEIKVGKGKNAQTVPAIQWLLEVISEADIADEREVFRVENLEVQETIGVKKREGMRYSRNEMRPHDEEFEKQVVLARQKAKSDSKNLSVYQTKILELSEKLSTYENLKFAFGLHNRIGGESSDEVLFRLRKVQEFSAALEEQGRPIFAVGPTSKDESWHMFSRAWILDLANKFQKNGKENKTVIAWEQILKAYTEDKPVAFNKAVDDLLTMTNQNPPSDVTPWVIRLEAYFNHVQPFKIAATLYLVAFILGAVGWLAWPRGFNLAASSLLVVTLLLHTSALVARLIISGRPPVTNLYSSAVFIGWGCVLLGLLFEVVYRIGIGNLVAAVAGYGTLLVADGLAADGDTFTVLQAVLDTQFWLATHVTCITLGYATTYLAGLFGVAYIVKGVCTPSLTLQEGRDIHRMIYGTLCFSIFFSFVGTVLGGLWADDSWGRFWGWDPKENAALIIVLWNALALHARWGGMVRERGLAALAVGGNIFVSWSWWGVNALGAGLHSYGFKQGTLQLLGLFIVFNLAIIGLATLPKDFWWSLRRRTATD
jgi:ABC-type transport system involved in cytochrome c biogenesis permease subunit